MCPMACGAPDTHGSSERTVTVYDYVVGRGQFRLSPVEVAVADTGNAAATAPVKLTVGGLVRIPSTAAGDTFVPAH